MYSSKLIRTVLALKLVVKLAGKALINFGGIESLGPPEGRPCWAQDVVILSAPQKSATITRRRKTDFNGIIFFTKKQFISQSLVVIAIVAILIFLGLPVNKFLAQVSKVAPVVMMSSTNRI